MDQPLIIEAMRLEDLDQVVAIEIASFTDPWAFRAFLSELETNNLAVYLSARLYARLIGYIGSWVIIDEVHITTLAVEAPFRRQGLATELLNALIARFEVMGARYITLEVRPSNTAARQFYEKHGFKVCGRRKLYYCDEDALIMTMKCPALGQTEEAVPADEQQAGSNPGD